MTQYTIKKLKFRKLRTGGRIWESGDYWIKHRYDGLVCRAGYEVLNCDSLAHGKELCQQHWESEAGIGKYLERVQ